MAHLRQWHSYLGFLIAPSVLFFALTGVLQIFGLHEAHGAYKPFAVVEKLGRLHKDQVFALSDREAAAPPEQPRAAATPAADQDDAPAWRTLVLKWFFATVAAGLALSTLLGLWIGLSHSRRRRLSAGLLAAGRDHPPRRVAAVKRRAPPIARSWRPGRPGRPDTRRSPVPGLLCGGA